MTDTASGAGTGDPASEPDSGSDAAAPREDALAATPLPVFAPPPPPDPEAAARRARRKHTVQRWTGAAVLVAVVGGGIGYTLTLPKRSDLPGLGTAADGRYVFPTLTLPQLPSGEHPPGDSADNPGEQHLADIRLLLLPDPQGAVADAALPGRHGWLSTADAVALSTDPTAPDKFAEYGLRHTAAAGWTTSSDGATTKIYLLQFIDYEAANTLFESLVNSLAGVQTLAPQSSFTLPGEVAATYMTVQGDAGITRYGIFTTGDAIVVVVQSGPTDLPLAPFQQVLTLQDQLLQ